MLYSVQVGSLIAFSLRCWLESCLPHPLRPKPLPKLYKVVSARNAEPWNLFVHVHVCLRTHLVLQELVVATVGAGSPHMLSIMFCECEDRHLTGTTFLVVGGTTVHV